MQLPDELAARIQAYAEGHIGAGGLRDWLAAHATLDVLGERGARRLSDGSWISCLNSTTGIGMSRPPGPR